MSLRPIINQFLTSKKIAIAGVSRKPKKFGNILYWTLVHKGYEVYPVNPHADTIEGNTCYHHLKDLPADVEYLLITTNKEDTETVVKEAIEKGFKNIWIQDGCETEEAIKLAKDHSVNLISNCCILMYAAPKGFHKFHQVITKWIGKYED
jgi:uncharacterized protein